MATGTVLGGRYALTRRIAVGGMGQVWSATDTVLQRSVAVKILRDELVDSSTFLERFRAEARHTASLAHPRTARYISPEQACGDEATSASDVYSLGVIGYEMLAGAPPFTADNEAALAIAHIHRPPPPLPPTIPAGVRAVIGQALSKNPADRPGDAAGTELIRG